MAALSARLSVVIRNNTHASVGSLLARPDISGQLAQSLAAAHGTARHLAEQAWARSGASPYGDMLHALLSDIDAAYAAAPAAFTTAISQAYESVPAREFVPGESEPGSNPAVEASVQRAQEVSAAIRDQASRLALRNQLTVQVASAGGLSARVLAEGRDRQAAGERVMKRWRSRRLPSTCRWCLVLDGVTVGLDEQFPHGGAVELKPGIATQPPAVYLGTLPGPPRHPHCFCWLELVTVPGARPLSPVVSPGAQEPPAAVQAGSRSGPHLNQDQRFLRASEIAALPESRYRALAAFLQAAVHELGQVLRKLLGFGH